MERRIRWTLWRCLSFSAPPIPIGGEIVAQRGPIGEAAPIVVVAQDVKAAAGKRRRGRVPDVEWHRRARQEDDRASIVRSVDLVLSCSVAQTREFAGDGRTGGGVEGLPLAVERYLYDYTPDEHGENDRRDDTKHAHELNASTLAPLTVPNLPRTTAATSGCRLRLAALTRHSDCSELMAIDDRHRHACGWEMADAELPSAQLRELQRTARRLMSDGELWLVYELLPPPFDRRQTASLIFESDTTVRRVRNYPPQWRDLSDEELFALSWDI